MPTLLGYESKDGQGHWENEIKDALLSSEAKTDVSPGDDMFRKMLKWWGFGSLNFTWTFISCKQIFQIHTLFSFQIKDGLYISVSMCQGRRLMMECSKVPKIYPSFTLFDKTHHPW